MVLANRFTFFTLLISPKFTRGMGCLAAGRGQWLLRWLPTGQEGLCPQSIMALPSSCTLRSEAPSHTAPHREPSPNSQSDLQEAMGEKRWEYLGRFFPATAEFLSFTWNEKCLLWPWQVLCCSHGAHPWLQAGYLLRAWSWRSYPVLAYSLSADICCKGGRTMVFFLPCLPLCLLLYAWKAGSEMSLLPPWGWKQTTCGLLLGPGLCAAGGCKKTQKWS